MDETNNAINAADNTETQIKEDGDNTFLSTEPQSHINVTIKNYKLDNGISSKFFENNALFGVTGPLGKGLGLSPKSKGVHMMFSAGTGILPYLDTVAKMLLQQCNALKPGDEKFHDDFKLVMFVGFQSRKDAIALSILEGLQHIVKTLQVPNKFRLFFRFSDQKSPRWNTDFIKKQLEIYQKETIAKIYVCGPPLLEE